MSITGLNGISPVFGTPTVFPTVKVTGGSLDVAGNLVNTFSGTIAIPLPVVGTQIFSGTFAGGGTVDLASKGTLDVGGTVDAGIRVDFTDGASDLLQLGAVTAATPFAFGGSIDDFRQGDTILLSSLHTATHFDFNYAGGVLTIADDAAPAVTVASLTVGTFIPSTFALNAGAGGLAITLAAAGPPAPSAPDLTAASDSGLSSTDNVTNVTAPTFSGSAEANATVDLFDGATLVGTSKASAAGAWSITSSTLASGKHSITAKAIDTNGTSVASAALAVTVDTTAPGSADRTGSGNGLRQRCFEHRQHHQGDHADVHWHCRGRLENHPARRRNDDRDSDRKRRRLRGRSFRRRWPRESMRSRPRRQTLPAMPALRPPPWR